MKLKFYMVSVEGEFCALNETEGEDRGSLYVPHAKAHSRPDLHPVAGFKTYRKAKAAIRWTATSRRDADDFYIHTVHVNLQ
jgi:hypothetical protein